MPGERSDDVTGYLARFGYRVLALVALALFGAYSFKYKSHYWPGSPASGMTWGSAYGWVLFAFGAGLFFGLQMGAFLGAVDYFGRRRPFTLFNFGFWTTFVVTDVFIFLVIPRIMGP
jgi:hypothetical protein